MQLADVTASERKCVNIRKKNHRESYNQPRYDIKNRIVGVWFILYSHFCDFHVGYIASLVSA